MEAGSAASLVSFTSVSVEEAADDVVTATSISSSNDDEDCNGSSGPSVRLHLWW